MRNRIYILRLCQIVAMWDYICQWLTMSVNTKSPYMKLIENARAVGAVALVAAVTEVERLWVCQRLRRALRAGGEAAPASNGAGGNRCKS